MPINRMPHSQIHGSKLVQPKMARLLVLTVSLVVLAWPSSCQRLPVLTPVTKDPATSLYTIPFHYGADLVVDIASPLVWSTCQGDHLPAAFACRSPTCKIANAYCAPSCRDCAADYRCDSKHKICKAYPYNPVTGACAAADLIHTRFVANTTDGRNPVSQVSVKALAACAPKKLLKSLPRGSTGVAGLASSDVALPAQVASSQKVAKKFLLCLPRSGFGKGLAIFGGGPLFLLQGQQAEYTQSLEYTPLLSKKDNPAYYVSVKSIALENTRVAIPESALATGGAVLCTREPYTLLRTDVYRPFADAFRRAMVAQNARETGPVAPFELCYDTRTMANTRLGYLVPSVRMTLKGGKNWTMTGVNSMVDVKTKERTACLAFVEMKGVKAGDGRAPAVLIGGFQMENFVIQFDLEKKRLGFLRLPFFTWCSHFNYTQSG